MALKLIKALQKEVSIKHLVHKALAGMEDPRPHSTIHASDLFKSKEFCPRERAFMDLGLAKAKPEFVGTALKMTFDHGRSMEYRFRNEWIRNLMVGYWKCGVCGNDHPSFGKAPKINCPKCGWGHQWEYDEVRPEDPESGVSGGVDGLLDVGMKSLWMFELKSMDKDEFRKLAAPLAEHRVRTALYLYLMEKSEVQDLRRVNTKQGTVVYVSKSYGFKDDSLKEARISDAPFSAIKEFVVNRDDSLFEYELGKAKALNEWRKGHKDGSMKGLPCGVCHNAFTQRAQHCSAAGPCFSGGHPSIITWKSKKGGPQHPGKPIVV